MERSGFFDAHMVGEEYDRVYLANSFASYFSSFIGNGIFGGRSQELQVVQMDAPEMRIKVLPGQGYIDGYWYENTSELSIPVDIADGVLNRIDIVVLRWGLVERAMWLEVRKGTPATTPIKPAIIRDADYFELQLAVISVPNGATNIEQENIEDTRLNNAVCGLVQGVVQQFDTTAFGAQLQSFINNYITRANNDYVPYEDKLAELSDQADTDYTNYFNNLESTKALASVVYDQYLDYIDDLKALGNDAHGEYLYWLQNLKDVSEQEIQDIIDELQGLIDGDLAASMAAHMNKKDNPHEVTVVQIGAVPDTRKVNNKELDVDVVLDAADVGARADDWMPTASDIGAATVTTFTATIPATGWTGSAAPYTKDVTVAGILATDNPIADIVQTGTWATDEAMRENWGKIMRIVTVLGKITVTASEVPTAAIQIQLEVVR